MFQITTRGVAVVLLATVCLLIAPGAPIGAAWGKPAIFEDLSLEAARAKAGEQERLLIVKGTAEWCGPCKMMDRTTWVDDRVVAWMREHGVAIAVDVDERPEEARTLGIRAMPTIIVYRGEEELGRFLGARDANGTLAFLEAARTGKPLPGASPVPTLADGEHLEDPFDHVEMLIELGQHEPALQSLISLWNATHKSGQEQLLTHAMQLSSMIGQLADEYEPARQSFRTLRDQAEARLRGESGSYEDLNEWLLLSLNLGHEDDVIAWIERIAEDDEGLRTLRLAGFWTMPMLIERDRLDLLMLVVDDPLSRITVMIHAYSPGMDSVRRHIQQNPEFFEGDNGEALMRMIMNHSGSSLAPWYAGLVRTEQHEDAERMLRMMFEFFPETDLPFIARGFADELRRFRVEVPERVGVLAAQAPKPVDGGP